MRVLKVLTSNKLPCGCLAGVYELYSGEVIGIVDAPDGACLAHRIGQPLEEVPRSSGAAGEYDARE
jgi:hypothetical protein